MQPGHCEDPVFTAGAVIDAGAGHCEGFGVRGHLDEHHDEVPCLRSRRGSQGLAMHGSRWRGDGAFRCDGGRAGDFFPHQRRLLDWISATYSAGDARVDYWGLFRGSSQPFSPRESRWELRLHSGFSLTADSSVRSRVTLGSSSLARAGYKRWRLVRYPDHLLCPYRIKQRKHAFGDDCGRGRGA